MSVGYRKGARQPRKIRYTEAEWSLVVDRARATGRPPARYVREVSLGATPKVRRGREHDEIIHELALIGTSLTRLESAAKENGFALQQESVEHTLAELLALVRRLA